MPHKKIKKSDTINNCTYSKLKQLGQYIINCISTPTFNLLYVLLNNYRLVVLVIFCFVLK